MRSGCGATMVPEACTESAGPLGTAEIDEEPRIKTHVAEGTDSHARLPRDTE